MKIKMLVSEGICVNKWLYAMLVLLSYNKAFREE